MISLLTLFDIISQWAVPATVLLIILAAARKGVPMYESFVTGAKEGFNVAVTIIPFLVAMLLVIKVFIASGIVDDFKNAVGWVMGQFGFGDHTDVLDLLPLALTRPLSGGGARGVMLEIFDQHGPDSFLGNTASMMMGSTETTFYVLTVYFGAVQIKKVRYTPAACLIGDSCGMIAAVIIGYLLFGNK